MVWTTPTPRTTGELITASIWNTDLKDNLIHLKTSISATDGSLDATSGILRWPKLWNYLDAYIGATLASGVMTINLQAAESTISLNQNVNSFQFINSPWAAGYVLTHTIYMAGDGTQRTLNWIGSSGGGSPPFFRWSGGTPLTQPTKDNGYVDIVTMRTYDGGTWFPAIFGQKM